MTVMVIQHGWCWACALLSECLKCWYTQDRNYQHGQPQQNMTHWVSNELPWHITFQAQILTCFWRNKWLLGACSWFSLYLVHVPLHFVVFAFESLHCHEFSSGDHILRPGVVVRMHSESNSVFISFCPQTFSSNLLKLRHDVINYTIWAQELCNNFFNHTQKETS